MRYFFISLSFIICVSKWSWSTISLIQGASNSANCSGASSCTTSAFGSALTNGSFIIACQLEVDPSSATTTYTDLAGNSYVSQITSFGSNQGVNMSCACASNTHTTSNNTVTGTTGVGGGKTYQIAAFEVTGITSCSNEAVGTNINGDTGVGGGQNETSGSATPITSGDLVVGNIGAFTGPHTVGTNFTAAPGSNPASMLLEYQIYNSLSAINPSGNNATNNDPYGGVTMLFPPAAGGATTTVCPSINMLGVGCSE